MNAEQIMATDEFQKILAFHGHLCPGLAIGYRAAKAALERLEENRSVDEEIVAVVENDACGVDAVQVLTGCTFGKGNFIFKDHGKQVFTFFGRSTGRAVRIALKGDALYGGKVDKKIFDKVRKGEASQEEKEVYKTSRQQKVNNVLEMPIEKLFDIKEFETEPPPKAIIESSVQCSRCGEPVMPSKMKEIEGESICRGCLEAVQKGE